MKYNFKNNKKGFTLIELLAVIIILSVIAIIVVPTVVNIIANTKNKAFKETAQGMIRAGELYYSNSLINNAKTIPPEGKIFEETDNFKDLEVSGQLPTKGAVFINEDGQVSLVITDNSWIASKCIDCRKVSVVAYTEAEYNKLFDNLMIFKDASGANQPIIKDGMIPIYFEGNTAKKADIKRKWYDYNNREWANAVLVTNATRDTYKNAAKGTNITEADVLAYLVWIPRYKYELFNTDGIAGTTPKSIIITFEKSTDPKSTGTTNDSYLTVPGFTFGNQELSGIWVGKFETTGDGTTPTIKPNVSSLTSQNVSTQFVTAQKFNNISTYGLAVSTDAHMMKNDEWGAVAYLSHSKYGINKQVRINNNQIFKTGCGASIEDGGCSANCEITYGVVNEYPQSTTGNITGIFDMSGGAWEHVMGNYNDTIAVAGFSVMPDAKYYNKYTTDSMLTACGGGKCLGNSLVETNNWYGDLNYFADASYPWFVRAGLFYDTAGSGLFGFDTDDGSADSPMSFRVAFGFAQ